MMASTTAITGKVNEVAHLPEARKGLFQRIEKPRNDLEAFEILYDLYFGPVFKEEFYHLERRAMQKMIAQIAEDEFFTRPYAQTEEAIKIMMRFVDPPPICLLERMLDWFDPQEKVEDKDLRRIAASALLKFLPTHPGIYYLASFKSSISRMKLDGDLQETMENLTKLIEAMEKRKKRDQEAVADCHE